jgi:hypothetical protein
MPGSNARSRLTAARSSVAPCALCTESAHASASGTCRGASLESGTLKDMASAVGVVDWDVQRSPSYWDRVG